ncbi:putative Metal dependent phosphohydrolase [Giardia muris]|uniref:5'-deoxynucleotidase n=1 Tax=Giardia muris TaxID=5742 RepID=A0A4Z1SS20_GIAMU|nr:putative Metal dependent phosphohydrolase [Giardia muris]|eukprot:TNJ28560.1 putative Metal dependent phosphohydrolase [Giardia muris]
MDSFVEFQAILQGLCALPRTGWTYYPMIHEVESVADHCLHTAQIALDVGYDLPQAERQRLVQMMLLHDLAESLIGDHIPEACGGLPISEKKEREAKAVKYISDLLRNAGHEEFASTYQALFDEYEAQKTDLSIMAHCLDKIDMLRMALEYERRYHVNLDSFFVGVTVPSLQKTAHPAIHRAAQLLAQLKARVDCFTPLEPRPD